MFFYCLNCDDYFHYYSVVIGAYYGFHDCPQCQASLRLIAKSGLGFKTLDDVPDNVKKDLANIEASF